MYQIFGGKSRLAFRMILYQFLLIDFHSQAITQIPEKVPVRISGSSTIIMLKFIMQVSFVN